MKVKCSCCGTLTPFYSFENKNKKICRVCNRYVFKDKRSEYLYRTKELLKKERGNEKMKKQEKRVEVLTTTDYKKFKKLLGNREVSPRRINKILASINAVGYITSPIVVNENMEIIDGQGRFEALKQLGLPIDYIVVKGAGIDACLNMNIYQEKWRLIDYINSYVERGNENYRKLKYLLDTYKLFSINVAVTSLNGIGRYNAQAIKGGTLVITDEEFKRAIDNLNYISPLIPYAKKTNGKLEPFFQAVIICRNMENVDEERLINKLKENIGIMSNWSDIPTAIQSIEDVYNKQLNPKNIIYMYTNYRKMVYSRGGGYKAPKEYYIDKVIKEGRY